MVVHQGRGFRNSHPAKHIINSEAAQAEALKEAQTSQTLKGLKKPAHYTWPDRAQTEASSSFLKTSARQSRGSQGCPNSMGLKSEPTTPGRTEPKRRPKKWSRVYFPSRYKFQDLAALFLPETFISKPLPQNPQTFFQKP